MAGVQHGGIGALLTEDVWRRFVTAGSTRCFCAGAVLLRQGDLGTHVLVLSSGHVKATRLDPDGNELLLALRGPGEVLGEMAVLDGTVRSATVTALDECVTRSLPAAEFRDLLVELDLTDVFLRHLLSRYREAEDLRAELADLPAPQRVVRVILRLAAAFGERGAVSLNLSQEDLSHAAGLSRSAVALELAELRRQGLVATGRRRILVHSVERLQGLVR